MTEDDSFCDYEIRRIRDEIMTEGDSFRDNQLWRIRQEVTIRADKLKTLQMVLTEKKVYVCKLGNQARKFAHDCHPLWRKYLKEKGELKELKVICRRESSVQHCLKRFAKELQSLTERSKK